LFLVGCKILLLDQLDEFAFADLKHCRQIVRRYGGKLFADRLTVNANPTLFDQAFGFLAAGDHIQAAQNVNHALFFGQRYLRDVVWDTTPASEHLIPPLLGGFSI
jgi:hypothetical protein